MESPSDEQSAADASNATAGSNAAATVARIAPFEAERILDRVSVPEPWTSTDAWGRSDPYDHAARSAAGCMVGERGHVAPGQDNTYLHRSWRADFELEEASFQDISALVYSLSSSDVATDFVNEAAIHVQRCLEARANAQGDVLVEPFDVTKFGLDPVLWRGVSSSAEIGWASKSRLAFFTPHGPDVYQVVFEFSEAAPTELGASRTRELLAQFDYAFGLDDLLPGEFAPDTLAMVETAVLQAFGPEALGWEESDHRCIAEQLAGLERRNFVVEDVAMQWCVPQKLAADWAERLSIGRILIDDPDSRLCYAEQVMNALRGNSFADALDIYDDNSGAVNVLRDSADSPERSALDKSLQEVCGISQDEGVRAGLPPHEPLDDALARADFCQGWLVATGNGIPPAWMSVAWVEGLIAPPAIVTQWSALGDFYALHGRSPERTQNGHEVREYLRINCSNDI